MYRNLNRGKRKSGQVVEVGACILVGAVKEGCLPLGGDRLGVCELPVRCLAFCLKILCCSVF